MQIYAMQCIIGGRAIVKRSILFWLKDRLILPIEVKSQWDIKNTAGTKGIFSFYPEVERAIVLRWLRRSTAL